MKEKVAIVGMGISTFERAKEEPFFEFAFEAASKALTDAGIDAGDIQQTVLAGYDLSCGRTISNMYTASAGCGYLKDEIRVAEDGTFALALASMRIMGGMETCMVLAYGVNSEGQPELVSHLTFDPLYLRPIGISNTQIYAMQALLYRKKAKVPEDIVQDILIKNLKNGRKSFLYRTKPSLPETRTLGNHDYAVYPLRKYEIPPKLDGAVALILAPESLARRLKKHYVVVEGMGWNNSSYYFGDENFPSLHSVKKAAERAYKMAGITNPLREINLLEITETTPYHELMLYEALGLCDEGKGKTLIQKGITAPTGKIPVNLSGGMLSGDVDSATGLARVAYIYYELMKGNHKQGVAHGRSGVGYQSNCVIVLRRV